MYQLGYNRTWGSFGATPVSEIVKALQLSLGLFGYSDTGSLGTWSKKVAAAIKAFQGDQGYQNVTGTPEYWTVHQLVERDIGAPPFDEWATLFKTATGKTPVETTWQIQWALRKLDFNPGPIDGLMGTKTKAGIKLWQKMHSYPETGVLDAATRAQLIAEASDAPIPLGTGLVIGSIEPPEVTQAVAEAEAAGVLVEVKEDSAVAAPKVIVIRDPATASIIKITKLVPAKEKINPWLVAGLVSGGVVATGTIIALVVRARRKEGR